MHYTERKLVSHLAEARRGSAQALGELLEEFRPYLMSLAGGELGSSLRGKASGSDVTQESLIQAAVGFPDFHGETVGEFRNWLARIFENRAIDLARRYRSEKRDVGRELRSGQILVDAAVDPQPSPSAQLHQTETLARLVEYLDELSDEEQTLIRWRYTDGLSFEEIATRLQWSRETTRRTWYRLIEQLGRRLEQNP